MTCGQLEVGYGKGIYAMEIARRADQVFFVSLELFIATLNSMRLELTDM